MTPLRARRGGLSSRALARAVLACALCGARAQAAGGEATYERCLELAAEQQLEAARREAAEIEDPLLRAQALVYVHFLAADYAGALPAVAAGLAAAAERGPGADVDAAAWLAERGAAAALYVGDPRTARRHSATLESVVERLAAEQRGAWREAIEGIGREAGVLESRREDRRRALERARTTALVLGAAVAAALGWAGRGLRFQGEPD